MTNLFEFSSSKRRFAVIGNPVAHSRSPEIHQMFGRQCGITLEYEAIISLGFLIKITLLTLSKKSVFILIRK